MRFTIGFLVCLVLSEHAHCQTVMLPTYHTFSYSGTVLVPDRGAVSLGGVNRAAEFSQERMFGGRNSTRSMFRSNVSAHARIIDLAEMDRQILGGTPEEFMRRERQKDQETASANEKVVEQDPVEKAKQLVRDARRCYRLGSYRAADHYYRRAIRELPEDLSLLAKEEYHRVMQRPPLAPAVAQR